VVKNATSDKDVLPEGDLEFHTRERGE
jgi:hypothetical protein